MICKNCGFEGLGMCPICVYGSRGPKCGGCCPRCGMHMRAAFVIPWSDLLWVLLVLATATLISVLLTGCGAPFTATQEDLSTAGAGGYPTMSQAGAGGRKQTNEAGGASPLASSGAGATATDAGAGGSGAATCHLAGWQGSSCDTCSSQASADGGRSCAEVLACYEQNGCLSAPCPGLCDYSKPTTDAAVNTAHAVLACRCKP